ncbi:MAG: HAD hydrolase family protein [Candidatus Delongbacteria bacterium]|nr:HAD hydrolase family protein [Candidatus Delongbacteria bacterium]
MTEPIFHIGIDLHGTLITNDEFLAEGSEETLKELLGSKPENIRLYICTGNDLSFLKRKIPGILSYFDGAVLETGCVVSEDMENEEIIVTQNIVDQIKDLENTLIDCDYPEVYKFGRRLSTISMFTKYGSPLEDFYQKISDELKYIDYARVTRSSVAVDIIPSKHDKFNGLEFFGKSKDVFVAVADSLNDLEWLKKADLPFMPGNSDPVTVDILSKFKEKRSVGEALDRKNFYISGKDQTFGVIEILKNIFEKYKSLN